ncbi:MAG: phospholipase [Moritella sp.]|uniref:phospholipase A n=1 Tax=Moritella sp. PE36 TaxID=58051 RepID=UPI0001568AB0|nr:putative outer membrane phospholipase A precursor [Moritella sp. PE36]PHR86318.1 MAG: phospholipase [Moritella sp.]
MESILQRLNYKKLGLVSLFLFVSYQTQAVTQSECIAKQVANSASEVTLGEIRAICKAQSTIDEDGSIIIRGKKVKAGVLTRRIVEERQNDTSEFVLTPHRMNYILPVYSTNQINPDAYSQAQAINDGYKTVESKFQLSLKLPLSYHSLFVDGDRIYAGFTIEAWWQVYANEISSPFRETNYRPEMFYVAPLDWHPNDANTGVMVGFEHQSNGRSGSLSRSWNRIYAEFIYEQGNLVWRIRPWYRLPEDSKADPTSPKGDDNPDIDDYMGNFEYGIGYDFGQYELSAEMRQNFATSNGSVQINLTTPLYGKLKGYITVFNGYGDSLIDYNHSQTRFGVGIALNNMF